MAKFCDSIAIRSSLLLLLYIFFLSSTIALIGFICTFHFVWLFAYFPSLLKWDVDDGKCIPKHTADGRIQQN